jgi:hypothetical protein
MTALDTLKRLLGHIERTAIHTDPVHLLAAIPRDDVERAWAVVHAEDRKAALKGVNGNEPD